MEELSATVNEVIEKMTQIEKARNLAISDSRNIIRSTKRVIHSIHIGKKDEEEIEIMTSLMSQMLSSLRNEPDILYGNAVEDAMMEYSEALLLCAVVDGEKLPSYKDLKITPQAWAMGLADCLGEMRRILLKDLMNSDIKTAEKIFLQMEEISDVIMMFDVPDAILPIRRKQDITRGIIERTRSDITNAIVMNKVNHEFAILSK